MYAKALWRGVMSLLPILYIDAHLIVIDKPAGLAVHAGSKTPYSLDDRLSELTFGFQRLPQPAHRLDRDTSGCLVLARHPKALKRLGQMFEAKQIEKTYLAIIDGVPGTDAGRIDAPLEKVSTRESGWRMVVGVNGKSAQTNWQVIKAGGGRALVEFRPETGRTHQIRAHAAHALFPIAGDPVYGAGGGDHAPMRLHSARLVIPYAKNGAPVDVTADLPTDWPTLSDQA